MACRPMGRINCVRDNVPAVDGFLRVDGILEMGAAVSRKPHLAALPDPESGEQASYGAVAAKQLGFNYDYMGRRVLKVVTRDGVGS